MLYLLLSIYVVKYYGMQQHLLSIHCIQNRATLLNIGHFPKYCEKKLQKNNIRVLQIKCGIQTWFLSFWSAFLSAAAMWSCLTLRRAQTRQSCRPMICAAISAALSGQMTVAQPKPDGTEREDQMSWREEFFQNILHIL